MDSGIISKDKIKYQYLREIRHNFNRSKKKKHLRWYGHADEFCNWKNWNYWIGRVSEKKDAKENISHYNIITSDLISLNITNDSAMHRAHKIHVAYDKHGWWWWARVFFGFPFLLITFIVDN